MDNIKLFVCCHQIGQEVPKYPFLYPIQVGSALADTHFPGFLYDDTGENISRKNRSYCELTAQYWAWKNVDAEYYGFFHYRRYLYPDIPAGTPYCIEKSPSPETLRRLGFEKFPEYLRGYDLISPIGEDMHISAREQYARANYHHKKDLDLAEQILKEQAPQYAPAAEAYLSQSVCYFGNLSIMRRPVFQEYCSWLFSILEEFDRRADTAGYLPQEQRVDGYLAERLFGIYLTYQKQKKTLRIGYLPRVHFEPSGWKRWRRVFVNRLLPPGSRVRGKTKSAASRLAGKP